MIKKRIKILIVIIIGIAIVGRVIYVYFSKETIATNYPLNQIIRDKDLIRIYLSDEASLDEVVNLSIFKGVLPTMTFDEVINKLGTPQDFSTRFETEFIIFYTNYGRIEFGNSWGILIDNSYYNTNVLMFYKEDFSKDFLFLKDVIKYLPKNLGDTQIGIFEKENCNFVINLSSSEEDWIQWDHEN